MNKGIDTLELQRIIYKVKVYQRQEDLIFDDLQKILNNLKYAYSTDNSKTIENINTIIQKKFSDIIVIHKNNIIVINKNIEKYENLQLQIANKFSNI